MGKFQVSSFKFSGFRKDGQLDCWIGGARLRRALTLLVLPLDLVHVAFERPIFHASDQFCAHRIFLNINPFCRTALFCPQTVMPSARLKIPIVTAMPPAEIPFPVSDPLFNREGQIPRRAKCVQMIRHQQIIADQPRGCRQPGLVEKVVGGRVCQPGNPVFRCDRQQNKIGAAQLNMDSSCRISSANFDILLFGIHKGKLFRARRSLAPPDLVYVFIHFAKHPRGSCAPRARREEARRTCRSAPRQRARSKRRWATSSPASPFAGAASPARR